MKSINFNTGIKKYAINGDESNVISVNISDVNLLKRIKDSSGVFDDILGRLDREENTPELLAEVDAAIKEELDRVFGTDISAHAFGDANCLSPLEDGNLLFMAFFEAFAPAVLEDINSSGASFRENTKLNKYLPESKPQPVSEPIGFEDMKFTPEQLEFLRKFQTE